MCGRLKLSRDVYTQRPIFALDEGYDVYAIELL